MRLLLSTFLVAAVVIVECHHTFMGTNVQRPLLHKETVKYSSKLFQKRIETYIYNAATPYMRPALSIQGILAYDLTNSSASVNVTNGGLGYSSVALRMKSENGKPLHYDVYIYG